VSKEPPDGRIIKQGTTTSLSCASNINWFFCVWKSPGKNQKFTLVSNFIFNEQFLLPKGHKNEKSFANNSLSKGLRMIFLFSKPSFARFPDRCFQFFQVAANSVPFSRSPAAPKTYALVIR
jgi:hypothetical protein